MHREYILHICIRPNSIKLEQSYITEFNFVLVNIKANYISVILSGQRADTQFVSGGNIVLYNFGRFFVICPQLRLGIFPEFKNYMFRCARFMRTQRRKPGCAKKFIHRVMMKSVFNSTLNVDGLVYTYAKCKAPQTRYQTMHIKRIFTNKWGTTSNTRYEGEGKHQRNCS